MTAPDLASLLDPDKAREIVSTMDFGYDDTTERRAAIYGFLAALDLVRQAMNVMEPLRLDMQAIASGEHTVIPIAELEPLRRDARRWREFRSMCGGMSPWSELDSCWASPEAIDAEIDGAMMREKP